MTLSKKLRKKVVTNVNAIDAVDVSKWVKKADCNPKL